MNKALSAVLAAVAGLVASGAARADVTTDWVYYEPASIPSSRWWAGRELLANAVTYEGAVYLVAACSDEYGRCLYRITGAGRAHPVHLLDPGGQRLRVEKGSFAFVAPEGRIALLTEKAIHSCDLAVLPTPEGGSTLRCKSVPSDRLTVERGETPAMGPDGTLYYRKAGGQIVAYDPELRKMKWPEGGIPPLTAVSPIALSASGRYAYVLAEIPPQVEPKRTPRKFALLRIETAKGETVQIEVEYRENKHAKGVAPILETLFRPAVVSKINQNRNVDCVFVAGNTNDNGILQLVAFEETGKPEVVWSQLGKIAAAPVLGPGDGNALFVVQQDELRRYAWWDASERSPRVPCVPDTLKKGVAAVTSLLIDRAESVYLYGHSLYVYPTGLESQQVKGLKLLFTADGALIGYNSAEVHDLSPTGKRQLRPRSLTTGTIYRAESIDVSSDASRSVRRGDRVILKGSTVALRKGFRWPLGATLLVQSEQPAR